MRAAEPGWMLHHQSLFPGMECNCAHLLKFLYNIHSLLFTLHARQSQISIFSDLTINKKMQNIGSDNWPGWEFTYMKAYCIYNLFWLILLVLQYISYQMRYIYACTERCIYIMRTFRSISKYSFLLQMALSQLDLSLSEHIVKVSQ